MTPLEQYRQSGLKKPISLGITERLTYFLIFGGGFLMVGIALVDGTELEQAVGLFGVVFFGFCLGLCLGGIVLAMIKSRRRGLVQFSQEGVYLAHFGAVFPWEDIGPAWCPEAKVHFMTVKDVAFVTRNVSVHRERMHFAGKFALKWNIWSAKFNSGDFGKWANKEFLSKFGSKAGLNSEQMMDLLQKRCDAVAKEEDAVVFGIPLVYRFNTPGADLLEIINSEVIARGGKVMIEESVDDDQKEMEFDTKLRKLHKLHEDGILDDDEYAKQKQEILDTL